MNPSVPGHIPQATDLRSDAQDVRRKGIPILLYVTRPDCPYCARLEKEVLRPIIRSGDYEGRMIIREVDWASTKPLYDFQGRKIHADELVSSYSVVVTPTLIFVSATGEMLADPLVGYNGSEFYEYYLNRTLVRATAHLKAEKEQD